MELFEINVVIFVTDDNKLIRKIEDGKDFLNERFGRILQVFSTGDLSKVI